jgi:hypothetical protein
LTIPRIAIFGVVGATAIWFSHPSVFILAGVGVSIILFCLRTKEWARIGRLLITYSLWALSFVGCYFVSLRNLSNNENLLNFWRHSFMPFPPLSLSDVKWFIRTFFEIFNNPIGLSLSGIAALTFVIGCISLFLEKKKKFFLLISPLPFLLLASGLHKYPFRGRLLLFIVPFVLLFIAQGAEQIRAKTSPNSPMIGITLIGLLVFNPLGSAIYHLIKPRTREEIKPVISYIREHQQDGDLWYLYYASWPAVEYYSKIYGYNKSDYIIGVSSRDNWNKYIEDLDKLRGNKRVWILFSHVCTWKGVNEEKLFLHHLDNIGTRLDSFKSSGAAVYLYDLSKSGSDR